MKPLLATLLLALSWSDPARAEAREAPKILRLEPAPAQVTDASAIRVAVPPGSPSWWSLGVAALLAQEAQAPAEGRMTGLDAPDGIHHIVLWGDRAALVGPSGVEIGTPADAKASFETATLDGGPWTDGRAPWVVAEGTLPDGAHALALRAADSLEAQGLVRLDELLSGAVIHMRYTTADNFTGAALYPPGAACYLLPASAEALIRANHALGQRGARLLVYDCYRPLHVQRRMWELHPVPGQVAPPYGRGSAHNRGAAVDVGLVDSLGHALVMPSPHDSFGPEARLDATAGIPAEAIENRTRLHVAMREAGFMGINSEWWHFEGPDRVKAVPLDAAFPDWAGPVPGG